MKPRNLPFEKLIDTLDREHEILTKDVNDAVSEIKAQKYEEARETINRISSIQ